MSEMHNYRDPCRYADWIRDHDTLSEEDRGRIRNNIASLVEKPLFSIVILPADGDAGRAGDAVGSLMAQLYPHWQAWLPGDALPPGAADARLNVLTGEADFLHDIATMIAGQLVLPMPADAVLSERALYKLAIAVQEDPQAVIFFSDEDRIDATGHRSRPRLKTAWDPDLMLGRDAIGSFAAYDREFLKQLCRGSPASRCLSLYDLALRATSAALPTHIRHIPAILCHRRMDPDQPPAWEPSRMRETVRRHLATIGDASEAVPAPLAPQWNRIIRPLPSPAPMVSIILPTRDRADLLERSTRAVLSGTDYPSLELLIVDNGSREADAVSLLQRLAREPRVRILSIPGPFNYAALNNQAARSASGDILLLLNNDTDVSDPDWLREMVSHAVREESASWAPSCSMKMAGCDMPASCSIGNERSSISFG